MRAAGELPPPDAAVAAAAAAGGEGAAGKDEGNEASHVVSLGTFSKILAPGLRLGWAEASPPAMKRLLGDGVLISGGERARVALCASFLHPLAVRLALNITRPRGNLMHTSFNSHAHINPQNQGCIAPFSAAVAHSAIELGLLADHLTAKVRPALASRCAALCAALDAHAVPLGCSYDRPSGGYFVWLRLPRGVDARALLEGAAARHKVRFAPGPLCLGPADAARLSFSFYSEAELEEAARRLAAALREALGEAPAAPA